MPKGKTMNDDNKEAVSPSVPLNCSTARRLRATVFLSKEESSLLYKFAAGTDSGNKALNKLCDKLEKMAANCYNRHLQR